MSFFSKHKLFIVLTALLAITGFSWAMTALSVFSQQTLAVVIMLLAFFKARLIIVHYMQVYNSTLLIRLAFEVWLVIAAIGTIWLYWQ